MVLGIALRSCALCQPPSYFILYCDTESCHVPQLPKLNLNLHLPVLRFMLRRSVSFGKCMMLCIHNFSITQNNLPGTGDHLYIIYLSLFHSPIFSGVTDILLYNFTFTRVAQLLWNGRIIQKRAFSFGPFPFSKTCLRFVHIFLWLST